MSGAAVIRADLHNHSHYSPDSILSPKDLVRRARQEGLDCIAVTDHNTVRGGLAARELADGLTVIVGEEVRTSEGEVLGLFLSEDIPKDLSPAETISRIHEQGGIVGIPHPFDNLRSSLDHDVLVPLIDQVDFIEALNARIVFANDNKKALELARRHQLPTSAASDAHSPREIGRCYVEMPPFADPREFVGSLRQGRLVGRLSSPLIHLISRYAVIRHKLRGMPE
jgi:predicted metal-dependent phosphoesterase TrpH